MTRVFDQQARTAMAAAPPLFGDSVPSNVKPKELQVSQVPSKIARPYIATGHYSGTYPDSTRESFAGYYEHTLSCAVTFGMGANHAAFTAIDPDVEKGHYRELTRLWVDDDAPRNTASRLVSEAIKRLPDEVRLVVSFADTAQNHAGYIYQALNFVYLGLTNPGKPLVDENGNGVHPSLLGIYRMRRKEFCDLDGPSIAKRLGWKFVEGSVKHRYALAVGPNPARRKLHRVLVSRSLPYPKLSTEGHHGTAIC